MYPMSFAEFLITVGEDRLLNHIQTVDWKTGLEQVFAARLEELFRQYLLVGGMPRVVKAFEDQVLMEELQRLQSGLIRTYIDDFAKYASTAKHKYLKEVYSSAPQMAARRYKYSHVNPGIEAKFLKEYPKTLLGIRYSMRELSYFDQILSIPLYMVNQTQRLVRICINF